MSVQKFSTENGDNRLIVNGLNVDTIGETDKYKWMNFMTRYFSISGNNITFASGQMQYKGQVYKDWDDRCIPMWIYGIHY